MKWIPNGNKINKKTQKVSTEKWRQCNRLRMKHRDKREKGKYGQEKNKEKQR